MNRLDSGNSSAKTERRASRDDSETESDDGRTIVTCDVCEAELNNMGAGSMHCAPCKKDYCAECVANPAAGICKHELTSLEFVPFKVRCKCLKKCKKCACLCTCNKTKSRCKCKCKPLTKKRPGRYPQPPRPPKRQGGQDKDPSSSGD